MKTTPIILFLTCVTLVAQTPPVVTNSGSTIDSATRDAILRAAVRDFDAELTNASRGATNSAARINPAPTNARPVVPVVVTTNTPVVPPAAVQPVVETSTTAPAIPAMPAPIPGGQPIRTVPIPVVPAAAPAPAVTTTPVPAAQIPPVAGVPTPIPTAVPAAAAEPVYSPGEIQFPQMDLNTFLDFYAKLVNRTVLRSQSLPTPTITLKTQTQLTRTEAIQAFDTILAMNQIIMINVGEKFVKAVPAGQANIEPIDFVSDKDRNDLSIGDQYMNYIVHLKHVKPSEMVPVLTPVSKLPGNMMPIDTSMILILRDFSSNIRTMLDLIEKVDIDFPQEYDSELIPIRYAQASEIASALGSLGSSTAASIGTAASAGGRGGGAGGGLGAPSLGGFGGNTPGAGGRGGLGSTGGAYGAGGVSGLGGTSALGGAAGGRGGGSSFADRLNNIMRGSAGGAGGGDFQILGRSKIVADLRQNSLLVFATKQDMVMIKKIIDQLDVVLAQVLIDTIIMEVSLDDTRNIGFNYLQSNPKPSGGYYSGIAGLNNGTFLRPQNFASTGTNGPNIPGGFSYAANFGNDFQATVTAIATDSRVNVLSRPSIQTSHAVTASLRIGDTVPYVTGTYFGGVNGTASSQYQQTFVGIDLEVTPLINQDGLVVMDIYQDVQQLGPTTTIDGNAVPTTTQRTAKATVSVRDRDTIILGGFISNSKSKSHSGMPFLKDVPGLGYLFRSSVDGTKRVELVVLIRPTVLPTPEDAALAATSQRDRLPGVKAAEAEFRKDENKRLQKADSIKVPNERQ